jgi:hypothetical protein
MNKSQTYHPTLLSMMVSLRARHKLGKEGTNKKKVTEAVPGNEKKHGTRTKESWPNTTREN